MKRAFQISMAFAALALTRGFAEAKTIDDEDLLIVEETEQVEVEKVEEEVSKFDYSRENFAQVTFKDKETGERVFRWSDKMLKNGLVHHLSYDFYDKEVDRVAEGGETKADRPWLIVFVRDRFRIDD